MRFVPQFRELWLWGGVYGEATDRVNASGQILDTRSDRAVLNRRPPIKEELLVVAADAAQPRRGGLIFAGFSYIRQLHPMLHTERPRQVSTGSSAAKPLASQVHDTLDGVGMASSSGVTIVVVCCNRPVGERIAAAFQVGECVPGQCTADSGEPGRATVALLDLEQATSEASPVPRRSAPVALTVVEAPTSRAAEVCRFVDLWTQRHPAAPMVLVVPEQSPSWAQEYARLPRPPAGIIHGSDLPLLGWMSEVMVERCANRHEIARLRAALATSTREQAMLREHAQVAQRTKSEFLANVNHEIRTPMNAILGFTRLALRDPLAPEQRTRLQFVHEASVRLLRVLDNLLDFSRLTCGRLTLERAPFEIHALIRDAVQQAASAAADKRVALEYHIEPAVPPRLIGDEARLGHVLRELLDNSVKFTEAGMVHVQVSLDEESPETATLRINVTDTGTGVPLDRQEIIFESFAQADGSSTRRVGGMGLGLTISKQLVDLMGGQIGFRSTPGEGSVFWTTISLPKAPPADSPATPAQEPAAARTDSAVPRLLLVESDRCNRHLLELLLTRCGYLVEMLQEEDDIPKHLELIPYRAALLSLGERADEGLARLAAICQREWLRGAPTPPLVALLREESESADLRRRCLEAGARDCLVRRPCPEEVLAMLHRVTGQASPPATETVPATVAHAIPLAAACINGETRQRLHDGIQCLRTAWERGDTRGVEQSARFLKDLAERCGHRPMAEGMFRVLLAARTSKPQRGVEILGQLDRLLQLPHVGPEFAAAATA